MLLRSMGERLFEKKLYSKQEDRKEHKRVKGINSFVKNG